MSIRRLFPDRWARIAAWTGAAVAWGTAAVAVSAAGPAVDTAPPTSAGPILPVITEPSVSAPAMPTPPPGGLVVIRFTPAERPAARVITQVQQADAATSRAPAVTAPAPPAAPPTVTSSGS